MSFTDRLQAQIRAIVSAGRLGQFVSVGVVGFVFDVTTATVLRELGVFPELAAFIGIEVAVLVMFLLNDNWTFKGEGEGGLLPTLRRLLTSNVVRGGGILVQLTVFVTVFRLVAPLVISEFGLTLDIAGIDGWFVVAKAAGIGVGMVVNFIAESLLTWRVHHAE